MQILLYLLYLFNKLEFCCQGTVSAGAEPLFVADRPQLALGNSVPRCGNVPVEVSSMGKVPDRKCTLWSRTQGSKAAAELRNPGV